MKQHISIDQLQELTPEQQERLREWWQPQTHDIVRDIVERLDFAIDVNDDGSLSMLEDSEGVVPPFDKRGLLPLLFVGQCIELLNGVPIEIRRSGLNNPFIFNGEQYPELIDALWQAVKEVL